MTMCLYTPTFDSDRDDEFAHFTGDDTGDFDILVFWFGRRFDGAIPPYLKLFVQDGDLGDYTMCPSSSWEMFSDRAAEVIAKRAGDAVQFFDAPLYRKSTGKFVPGYKILNATCAIPCMDLLKSQVEYDECEPGRIEIVHKWVFDDSMVPSDLHVFRAAEYPPALYFSRRLMEDLMTGPYLKDLAFLEYGGDEVTTIRRRKPAKP